MPVSFGSGEPVLLDVGSLRPFPGPSAQFLSFEDMAARATDLAALFSPGQHVTLTGLHDAPELDGATLQVVGYSASSRRYEVRLLPCGDCRAFRPWHLSPVLRDEQALREVFQSPDPRVKEVCTKVEMGADLQFTDYEDDAVVWAMRRLVQGGLWLGNKAVEESVTGMCELAEHPSARRAMRILREQRERKALLPTSVAGEEIEREPGLKLIFERLDALKQLRACPLRC